MNITRKYIYRALGILLTIVFLLIAWHFFHTGKVIIASDDPNNTITVTKANDPPSADPVKQASGELSARLAPGEYTLTVSGKLLATKKAFVIKPRQTLRYNIQTPVSLQSEPVAGIGGSYLTANDSQLRFLSTDLGEVQNIDSSGTSVPIGTRFQSLEWADSQYGLGQDDKGGVYVISGDTATPYSLPQSNSDDAAVGYAITNTRRLYISLGSDIYTPGNSGTLSKIHTTAAPNPQLAASKDALAIINVSTQGDEEQQKPYVETVTSSGQSLAKKSIRASRTTWSPDGKLLAVIGDSSALYDKKLNQKAVVPGNGIDAAAWLNNDTLVYATDSTVWKFSLSSGEATTLAVITPGDQITDIAITPSSSYIYIATRGSDQSHIERIGLHKQPVRDLAYRLSAFLPTYLVPCTVTYLNFSTPGILLKPYSASQIDTCKTEAKASLSEDRFDVERLPFYVGPVLSQSD